MIFFSVNIPLNNGLLIFALLFVHIKSFFCVTFDNISWITIFHDLSCFKFPELMRHFEALWNDDACSICLWFILRWEYHVIFCTEDRIFSLPNWSDSKFLIGPIIPFVENDFIILLRILWYIQHHIVTHSRNEPVQTIFRKAHLNRSFFDKNIFDFFNYFYWINIWFHHLYTWIKQEKSGEVV